MSSPSAAAASSGEAKSPAPAPPSTSSFRRAGDNNADLAGELAVSTGVIETLKARIVELEAAQARDQTLVQRAAAENERTQVELLTHRKNVEILQSNVETLKALAVQLACELEEANLQLATMKEKQTVVALKAERDVSYEVENLKRDCERRIEELRAALSAEQEGNAKLVALHQQREEEALVRLKRLEAEKDAMIRSLTERIDVLQTTITYQTEHQHAIAASSSRSTNHNNSSGSSSGKAATAAKNGGYSGPGPSAALRAQPSSDPKKTNIIALAIAMNNDDIEATRFIRGVGHLPRRATGAGTATATSRFHVDVSADPSVAQPAKAMAVQSAGDNFNWAFVTPFGDELRISIDVKQPM